MPDLGDEKKKKQSRNKPNHIALLTWPSVVRKMLKSLTWLNRDLAALSLISYWFLWAPDTSAAAYVLGCDVLLSVFLTGTPMYIYLCLNNSYLSLSLTLNIGQTPLALDLVASCFNHSTDHKLINYWYSSLIDLFSTKLWASQVKDYICLTLCIPSKVPDTQ